jgi:hypothetical protein
MPDIAGLPGYYSLFISLFIPFSQKILEYSFRENMDSIFAEDYSFYLRDSCILSSSIQESEIGSRDWTLGPKDPGLLILFFIYLI